MNNKLKRILASIFLLVITFSLVNVEPIMAEETNSKSVITKKVSSINLDGKLDEVEWADMEAVDKLIVGDSTDITAAYKTLWDDNNLYIGIKVIGNNDSINYDNDSITFYLAPFNYIGSSPAKMTKMGFDLMVFREENDESVLVWNGSSDDWQSTEGFGTIVFNGEGVTDTDSYAPSVTMESNEIKKGSAITVNYTGTANNDWIGIYKSGTTPGSSAPSIGWKYTKDTAQPNGTVSFTASDFNNKDLEPGSYDAILMENDGYGILGKVTFTITAPAPEETATKVEYNRTASRKGYADGTVVITQPDNKDSFDSYNLYYGNQNGKLAGYSKIGTVSKSDAAAVSYKFNDEKPLYKFQVMSDIHITSYDSIHNTHLNMALQDIKKMCSDSSGIIAVGDSVNHGSQIEYDALNSIINANKDGLPNIYFALGNHELFPYSEDAATANYSCEERRKLFLDNTNTESIYYDKWINGQHFIFLGSEANVVQDDADLSETQLKWLEDKLAESKDSSASIFLFVHQSLPETVAGSIGDQGWDGVVQSDKLREIISKYPQVVYFSGHSHWELESKNVMYDGGSTMASMFDTAAVGYLWTDSQEYKEGSQGYYVEVYKDKILVKGRDFVNSTWIPAAQFVVDLNEKFPAEAIRIHFI